MAHLIVDGTPREIRLELRTLREAERLMARGVMEVLGQHGALFKLDELAAILWAAWRREDRKLTLDLVYARMDAIIQRDGLLAIQTAVTQALMDSGLLAMPGDGDEDRPPRPEPATTPGPGASTS
jgi:hypothetical protein